MSKNPQVARILALAFACGTIGAVPAAGAPLMPEHGSESGHALIEFMQELATVWSRSERPRHWMLAAHALQATNGEQVDGDRFAKDRAGLVERALAAAPDDTFLWWQVALACPAMPVDCPVERALARLKALEPDNAAVWSLAASREQEASGARITDALSENARSALSRAAASKRYEVPIATMFEEASTALASVTLRHDHVTALEGLGGLPESDLGARSTVAFGYALMMSPHISLVLHRVCRPDSEAIADPTVRDDCIAYSALMAREGKELSTAHFGLTMQSGLLDGPDAVSSKSVLRELDWLTLESRRLGLTGFATDEELRAYLEDWRRSGEIEAMRRRALRAGVPLVPPAEFRSPSVTAVENSQANASRKPLE